ncbi:MAG: hypothetical protein WC554_11715 [Clostridia bacterium]
MTPTAVAVLRTAPDQWRERLALELEAAARRVRACEGRPAAVGIIVVEAGVGEDNDVHVYTAHEGVDHLRLMAGCHILARRIDDVMEVVAAGPAPTDVDP